MLHSEWLKDILRSKLAQRLARNALNQHREEKISRVAVQMLLSWFEVQLPLTCQQIQKVLMREAIISRPAREIEKTKVIRYATRVVNEMAYPRRPID